MNRGYVRFEAACRIFRELGLRVLRAMSIYNAYKDLEWYRA